jgi:hypothetical protein
MGTTEEPLGFGRRIPDTRGLENRRKGNSRMPVLRSVFGSGLLCIVASCTLPPKRDARLDGEWIVTLQADSVINGSHRLVQVGEGVLVISKRIPDFPIWAVEIDKTHAYAVGRYQQVSFPEGKSPLGRDSVTRSVWEEVEARVLQPDTAAILVSPRVADGGLALTGLIVGSAIRGSWVQHGYCCGARGSFVMRRRSETSATRAAIADALHNAPR